MKYLLFSLILALTGCSHNAYQPAKPVCKCCRGQQCTCKDNCTCAVCDCGSAQGALTVQGECTGKKE